MPSFSLLLSRYSGNDDIVVGVPTANRLQLELAPLVGLFVNVLALRVDCSAECDFNDFLAEVKKVHLAAQANQAVPFDKVVDRLKPNRSDSYPPVFQIMFTMNTNEKTELALPGVQFEALDNVQSEAKYELSLVADTTDDGLMLEFNYNRELFDGDFIGQMAGHFGNLLRAVVANPGGNIHELPLFDEAETRQLIAQINQR